MNFGAWLPFEDAPAVAPASPGVLQARADTLLPYPKGMSAMVLYARCAAPQTLKGYVTDAGAARLARAVGLGARWIRFGLSPDPHRDFGRLMERFVERFGAKPAGNGGAADEDDEEARSLDG